MLRNSGRPGHGQVLFIFRIASLSVFRKGFSRSLRSYMFIQIGRQLRSARLLLVRWDQLCWAGCTAILPQGLAARPNRARCHPRIRMGCTSSCKSAYPRASPFARTLALPFRVLLVNVIGLFTGPTRRDLSDSVRRTPEQGVSHYRLGQWLLPAPGPVLDKVCAAAMSTTPLLHCIVSPDKGRSLSGRRGRYQQKTGPLRSIGVKFPAVCISPECGCNKTTDYESRLRRRCRSRR